MELAKNRASGKIFVVLDNTGVNDFLAITPGGAVKRLERRLFVVLGDQDHESLDAEHLITEKQLHRYEDYFGETVKS
jgi:hypothetical protein